MVAVIICGDRNFNEYSVLKKAIKESKFEITEVISGKADGVDTLGEKYAKENNLPIAEFPADWNNLDVPGAVVKKNKWNKDYNVMAGFQRNEKMAIYAKEKGGAVLAIDNGTPGTADMIKTAKKYELPLYIYKVGQDKLAEGCVYIFGD